MLSRSRSENRKPKTALFLFLRVVKETKAKPDVVFERFQMPSKIGIMNANLSPKKKLYFFGNGGVSYQFDENIFKKKRFNLDTVVSSTIINRVLILVGMRGIQKVK